MRVIVLFFVAVAIAAIFVGCSQDSTTAPVTAPDAGQITATELPQNTIPVQAQPYGHTYARWSVLWWQWMASAPALPDENPVLDYDGHLIDYAQSGPVWFIAPSIEPGVVRHATIPPGKGLFVCLVSFEASSYEGMGETEEELFAAAAAFADLIEIQDFMIDGVDLGPGSYYRAQSDGMFSLTVPEDNVFDWWGFPADAGTYYPSVADGYYAMLPPLSAGDHTVRIDWTLADLTADLTIYLHVAEH